jgi:hypothetical protein
MADQAANTDRSLLTLGVKKNSENLKSVAGADEKMILSLSMAWPGLIPKNGLIS